MENALKIVRETIEESTGLPADRILTTMKLRDLAADSLEYVSMLQDLEDAVGIDADDIDKCHTVNALVARVNDSNSNAR